ncbi:hypothetical protein H0H81_009484 [Sphagnurus paluster]|uniref:TPR-like protein n=1 Tax=Sphagnurus paluster TaxID=117069 RepID=A0A9P7GW05_9AGAR|nr:hypothetical protein H0H81_009484 [Sphagnurus paluster]
MASSYPCNKKAEQFKAEGNNFHKSGQYQAAYDKYSEAIKEDPKNAILWANRAASAIATKKYMDAISDAEKATKLDPKYAKAWGRQGTSYQAIGTWSKSIDAFNKALQCITSTGELSKQDQVLKSQFEEGMKKSKEALSRPASTDAVVVPAGSVAQNNLPWTRALVLEQTYAAQKKFNSSGTPTPIPILFVSLIRKIIQEYQSGVDDMKKLENRIINGQRAMYGNTGVIEALSNAILRDRRAFHIKDADFFDKYNQQMVFEATRTEAWTKGGLELVQQEAPKRLRKLGWGAVRPALSVTIRGWFMRGFLQASLGLPGSSSEFIRHALDVLQWGSRLWKDVPREERGTIFDPTFIRGVKRLHMNILMESFSKDSKNCDYTLEDIAKIAREIASEDVAPPTGEIDPGFLSSFYIYPKADALVILGWYYMQKAQMSKDPTESIELSALSAVHYTQGAILFHTDDEYHVSFLKYAIDAHWYAGTPLKVTLPLCKKVRDAAPAMRQIWEYSSSATQRDQWIETILGFEDNFRGLLAQGKITLEESGNPDPINITMASPATSIKSSTSKAELLKAEGNAFHLNRQYEAAYSRYSQAIKQDSKNPILWANRAASALAMKKYMDAANDAEKVTMTLLCVPDDLNYRKATKLDPKYAKAWGRQAEAYQELSLWPRSVTAWKMALSCLPTSELTGQKKLLKSQFEKGLEKAEKGDSKLHQPEVLPAGSKELTEVPWKRALDIEQELLSTNNRDSMTLEINDAKGWGDEGPKVIQQEAMQRLKTNGWTAVRRALSITAYKPNSPKYALQDIPTVARELLEEELKPLPPMTVDTGFYGSFWRYPKGDALACLGWYYMKLAWKAPEDSEERIEHLVESGDFYIKAAEQFFKDDEYHVNFLRVGLEAYWHSGAPLWKTLPLCKRIREAIPGMKRIWEYSATAKQRDGWLNLVLEFEKNILKALAEGGVDLDTLARPQGLKPPTTAI